MKISFISFSTTGASVLYPYQMLTALAESGKCELQVLVASRAYNIENYRQVCRRHNIEFHEFETYKHNKRAVFASFFKIRRFKKIIRTVRNFKPDVIYFPFGCVWAPILYPSLNRIAPIINTLHDPHPHDESTGIAEFIFRKSSLFSTKYISGIVVLNSKDAEYIRNKYGKPVAVIPHAAFSFYTKLAKGIDCNTIKHQICFVGRIEPYKGVDILVEAFDKLKVANIKLIIAGNGTICEDTIQKISSNSDIMVINRFLTDEEMVEIIENSDIVILPYLRASQSGVIPMSFALGRTVIATKVGALEEQVKEGTGILVLPNADSIAKAIDKMYADEALIPRMSKNAKIFADKELTWEHSGELLVRFMDFFCGKLNY